MKSPVVQLSGRCVARPGGRLELGTAYVTASHLLTQGLTVVHVGLYVVISRFLGGMNRWVVAVGAVVPVVATWALGQGGGPLFGQGEGGTAALTYLTVSFFVDAVRGYAGCEVMALPALIFRTRTDVPCLLLCPIDHAEAGVRRE